MKEALTTGEVAKYCGVNFRTVIRWIEKGYLEAYKLPGRGDNRIPVPAFCSFLKSNGMPIPEELMEDNAPAEDETAPNHEETEESVPEGRRILVIEDEDLMAKSILRVLERAGFVTAHAANGIEAGILLERFKPHMITLDLQMPGMSGFEVLEALRANERYQGTKVLVVSAATKVKMLEVMELGVDGILEKPFKFEELLEKVQDVIR